MFLILICIYAFSNISGSHLISFKKLTSFGSYISISRPLGAHFNPAVTFATLLTQRVTFLRFGAYLVAQILGSLAGSGKEEAEKNESEGKRKTKGKGRRREKKREKGREEEKREKSKGSDERNFSHFLE